MVSVRNKKLKNSCHSCVPFVTPAKAGVGLNSVSNANQILTCSRSGIVNFIVLIPAYAGMTKHAYARRDKKRKKGSSYRRRPVSIAPQGQKNGNDATSPRLCSAGKKKTKKQKV